MPGVTTTSTAASINTTPVRATPGIDRTLPATSRTGSINPSPAPAHGSSAATTGSLNRVTAKNTNDITTHSATHRRVSERNPLDGARNSPTTDSSRIAGYS